jgi:dTDP-4-amino-4,6-dideoxygalactose transaminase
MINVTKTHLPDLNKYKEYVDRIFASGWLTNYGELVQELERSLKKYLDVEHLLVVANGTIALQVAYKVLNLKGNVITTPFSFVATTSSLVWEGLTPVFSDIDPETYTIDPEKLSEKINKDTSAILPVHVFGNTCKVEEIENIAEYHKLKTVYDAAHSFGVKYKGRGIGNCGDASVFSFHSTKIFHTIEGGAITFRDEDLLKKARLMINFGIPGPDQITELGINGKMNEFQAAMGLCILEDMVKIEEARKKIWDKYFASLKNMSLLKLQKMNPESTNNFSYFSILLDSEERLLKIKELLNKEDIYPRRYFYPSLETLPYINSKEVMKNSSDISGRILCLPVYESLEDEIQLKIIKIIKSNIAA